MNSDIMGCFRETIVCRDGLAVLRVLETGCLLKENSAIFELHLHNCVILTAAEEHLEVD